MKLPLNKNNKNNMKSLKNKLKNVGIGLVALTGSLMSSCEKDNPEYNLNDGHEVNVWKEKEVFNKLDNKVYTRSRQGSENKMIFFNSDDKTVTFAQSYIDPTDPKFTKILDKETHNTSYNPRETKMEVEGMPDIELSSKNSCGTHSKSEILSVAQKNQCYKRGKGPKDLSEINGTGEYKIHRNGLVPENDVQITFNEDSAKIENQSLLPKNLPYHNNGKESPYFEIDGEKHYATHWGDEGEHGTIYLYKPKSTKGKEIKNKNTYTLIPKNKD